MKDKTFIKVILLCYVCISAQIIALSFIHKDLWEKMDELEDDVQVAVYNHENLEMQVDNKTGLRDVNGIYFSKNDYYCVWVKERNPLNIARTEAHEYGHYLIDNGEREHFCE